MFWPCPRSTKFKMVLNIVNKEEMTKVFSRDVLNSMGLAGLNKLMLIYSHAEIARVLRVVADPRNHPVMIHCASGKDRTGLTCALILASCGVLEDEIINNYQESEKFLTPVMDQIQEENALKGLDSSFDGTPREVMQETLAFIHEKWGSITEYLDDIGFTLGEQKKLASVLMHRRKMKHHLVTSTRCVVKWPRPQGNKQDPERNTSQASRPSVVPKIDHSAEFYSILSKGFTQQSE